MRIKHIKKSQISQEKNRILKANTKIHWSNRYSSLRDEKIYFQHSKNDIDFEIQKGHNQYWHQNQRPNKTKHQKKHEHQI